MADAHLDHPGEVTWFPRSAPAPIAGPCLHECPHDSLRTIAWGPDYDHYTLNQCDVPDGCAGRCRAWAAEYPHPFTDGPKFRLGDWLTVASTDTEEER